MKNSNAMNSKEISAGQKAKGENGKRDCAVRAISAAFEVSYEDAHEFVEKNFGRKKNGSTKGMEIKLDEMIKKRKSFKGKSIHGVKEEQVTNLYGRNLRQSTVGRFAEKNPEGTFLVLKRDHAFTVKDGVVLDGTREKAKVTSAYLIK